MSVTSIQRVSLIDDDALSRNDLAEDLKEVDIEPINLDGPYGADVDRLVQEVVETGAQFVICDFKLGATRYASFKGTVVVEQLSKLRIPAMLLTMYQSTDRIELRAHRSKIPVIVGRDDFLVEKVPEYAEICRREIEGCPTYERRAHRVVIRIEEVPEGNGDLSVVVPPWRPDHALKLPISLVPRTLRSRLRPGAHLLGSVNIGATEEDELFFRDINDVIDPGQD